MTTESNAFDHQGNPRTNRECEFADEIDELFTADAEKVSIGQSNRRYRIRTEDIIRLSQSYGDLPACRLQAILNFHSQIWRCV